MTDPAARPLANQPATTAARSPLAISPAGRAAMVIAVIAVWLLGRPYKGITHDATLYVAQGLRQLSPARYSGDIFFAFGSQDSFSAFSPIYSHLIALWGPALSAMLLTILGQATFVLAVWWLIRALIGDTLHGGTLQQWWALVLISTVSGYYGGLGVFRFAEPFGTARSLAEPLSIAALAALLSSKLPIALVLLAFAALIHPLVAAPAIAVAAICVVVPRRGKTLPSAMKLATAATLLTIGAATAGGATAYFDPLWRAAVMDRSQHLFLLAWETPDWLRVAWSFIVALLARGHLSATGRRFVASSVAVCASGLIGSLLSVDILDNATFAGLQMWRAHWLLQMLAILLIPTLVYGAWRSGSAGKTAAACIIASCCFARPDLPASAVLAFVAAVLLRLERRHPGWMPEKLLKPSLGLAACAGAVGTLFDIQLREPLAYGPIQPDAWIGFFSMAGTQGLLLLFAACIALLASFRMSTLAIAAGLAIAVPAAMAWDSRSHWTRALEAAADGSHPFRAHVQPGAEVFWPAASTPAWLVLRTRSWFTGDQGAGIVFHRETAMNYELRRTASIALRQSIDNCSLSSDPSCPVDIARARALCERIDHPEFLVLPGRIDAAPLSRWPTPGYLGYGPAWIDLHACRDLVHTAGDR